MLYLSFCAWDYLSLTLFHDDDKCITANGQLILRMFTMLVPICEVAIIHFAQKI